MFNISTPTSSVLNYLVFQSVICFKDNLSICEHNMLKRNNIKIGEPVKVPLIVNSNKRMLLYLLYTDFEPATYTQVEDTNLIIHDCLNKRAFNILSRSEGVFTDISGKLDEREKYINSMIEKYSL